MSAALKENPAFKDDNEVQAKTDVEALKIRLRKEGFEELPADIKSWLKNWVYNAYYREPWDKKYDEVLLHYRLGNIF